MTHFVQETRAVVGLGNGARLCLSAKQLLRQVVCPNRPAIHRDERTRPSLRDVVQRAGNELLACAARSLHEDCRSRWSEMEDLAHRFTHGEMVANDVGQGTWLTCSCVFDSESTAN